jgi:hypothetical protein
MRYRRLGVAVAIVSALGVGVGLVISAPGQRPAPPVARSRTAEGAIHPVLTALTTTTGAANYAFDYTTTFQPGSQPGDTAPSPPPTPTTTSGHGVVDLDPYVMATTNSAGSSFPNVTAVIDSTDVWEFGAGDYGTRGIGNSAPGNALPGFAQLVEGSLGEGQGALAMISLSNPTGRLNLEQSMITSSTEVGTGMVDGVPVTNYQVSIDLSQELNQTGLSSAQRSTISQGLAILSQQGYEGTTELISIDSAGFIRQVKSDATFSNGGSMTSVNDLFDIGCAGTVTPGQPVPVAAPPGCVSPDQPGVAAAPATTPPAVTTTTAPQ